MLTSFDLFYISYTLLSWAFNELMVSIQLLQIRGLTFLFYVFSRNMIRVLLKFVCIIVVICRHVESRLLLTFEARIHVTNRKLKYLKCSMKAVWGDQIQFSTNATICPFYYTTMKVIILDILANLYFSLRFLVLLMLFLLLRNYGLIIDFRIYYRLVWNNILWQRLKAIDCQCICDNIIWYQKILPIQT